MLFSKSKILKFASLKSICLRNLFYFFYDSISLNINISYLLHHISEARTNNLILWLSDEFYDYFVIFVVFSLKQEGCVFLTDIF